MQIRKIQDICSGPDFRWKRFAFALPSDQLETQPRSFVTPNERAV